MSAKKAGEDSEFDHDAEGREAEEVPLAEAQLKPEVQPKAEAQPKLDNKPSVKAKARAEGEPKPAAKPETTTTKSIAEIMKFNLRTPRRPRR